MKLIIVFHKLIIALEHSVNFSARLRIHVEVTCEYRRHILAVMCRIRFGWLMYHLVDTFLWVEPHNTYIRVSVANKGISCAEFKLVLRRSVLLHAGSGISLWIGSAPSCSSEIDIFICHSGVFCITFKSARKMLTWAGRQLVRRHGPTSFCKVIRWVLLWSWIDG